MNETKPPAVRTALAHIILPRTSQQTPDLRSEPEQREEAVNLTTALGVNICFTTTIKLNRITPATLIGTGKLEELKQRCEADSIELLVLNTRLSPTQQRNLEKTLHIKVIDRTGLILEIFAARAQTKAGKLQVELARLSYEQSRLVRTWTHLERQRGGLGKTGGPGERQIEIDRRLLRNRITHIKKDLQKVKKERTLQRTNRTRHGLPVVALVGYTNAGKSTLFNALLEARGAPKKEKSAFVKNMLFATLDPLMRKIKLPNGTDIILSDTVGFISDLPHELVEAFKATLEEVSSAQLLVHVQDASSPAFNAQNADVLQVLKSIKAEKIPTVNVLNKADKCPKESHAHPNGISVSALKNIGIKALLNALQEELSSFK